MLSKKQILIRLKNLKSSEIPQNLVDQEVKIFLKGMKEEEKKK